MDKKDPCVKQLAPGSVRTGTECLPSEHHPLPISLGLPTGLLSWEQEETILGIQGGVPDALVLLDTALS